MPDTLRQQRFTRRLQQFSSKLDDLLIQVRSFEPQLLPVELIDEMATTTGELLLVLIDHQSVFGTDDLMHRVISDAQHLREKMRSRLLERGQLAEAVSALTEEVNLIIREDKRAA